MTEKKTNNSTNKVEEAVKVVEENAITPVSLLEPTLALSNTLTLTAVLRREGNMYVANCPELGIASQGATVDEAVANLKEATELYLEDAPEEAEWLEADRPIITTFEARRSA